MANGFELTKPPTGLPVFSEKTQREREERGKIPGYDKYIEYLRKDNPVGASALDTLTDKGDIGTALTNFLPMPGGGGLAAITAREGLDAISNTWLRTQLQPYLQMLERTGALKRLDAIQEISPISKMSPAETKKELTIAEYYPNVPKVVLGVPGEGETLSMTHRRQAALHELLGHFAAQPASKEQIGKALDRAKKLKLNVPNEAEIREYWNPKGYFESRQAAGAEEAFSDFMMNLSPQQAEAVLGDIIEKAPTPFIDKQMERLGLIVPETRDISPVDMKRIAGQETKALTYGTSDILVRSDLSPIEREQALVHDKLHFIYRAAEGRLPPQRFNEVVASKIPQWAKDRAAGTSVVKGQPTAKTDEAFAYWLAELPETQRNVVLKSIVDEIPAKKAVTRPFSKEARAVPEDIAQGIISKLDLAPDEMTRLGQSTAGKPLSFLKEVVKEKFGKEKAEELFQQFGLEKK